MALRPVFRYLALGLGFWSAACAALADVTVGVAANFRAPAEEIAQKVSETHGIDVRLVPGSSGKLAALVQNGAPIDIVLSADQIRPAALEAKGLTAARKTYAIGRLALFGPGFADGQTAWDALQTGSYRRLAVADARVAPYGLAGLQTLASLGLDAVDQRKLVTGENIGQTFGFVATGNADLGFVALSQVRSLPPKAQAHARTIEADLHDPILQDAVLVTGSADNPEARAFFEALSAPEVQAIIQSFGYEVPAP